MGILIHKAGNFLGAGVLQHAGEHGGIDLIHIQPRQIVVRAGAGEGLYGLGGENVLLRQDMAVGPQPGHLLKAARQGAEPLGGGAHGHIPVQLRAEGLVKLLDLVDAAVYDGFHTLLPFQQQHRKAGQVPAEEDVLRVLEKMGYHAVPDPGSRLGIGLGGAAAFRHGGHQRQIIGLGPQVEIQLFRLLVDFLHT